MVNGPVGAALYEALTKAGALGFLSISGTPLDEGEDRAAKAVPDFQGMWRKTAGEPASIIWMPVKS